MNLTKKGSVFLTFFGCCLAMILIAAALGTKWWVVAKAKRLNNLQDSGGLINLGLFEGDKHLNYSSEWRRDYAVHVVEVLNSERDFMNYGLWISTIASLSVGLLFSILSAYFAVLNTATNQYLSVTGLPGLYLWNSLSCLLYLLAAILWAIQFTQKLQYNVMTKSDLDRKWTSNNMAYLGYSYWLVLVAVLVHIVNMVTIYFGTREKTVKTVDPVSEKSAGAIMLY